MRAAQPGIGAAPNGFEWSAVLADAHAERYQQAERTDHAAQERRAAGRAREAAPTARSHAEGWLELAAERRPRPARMAARSMTAPPEESGRASRVTSASIASSFIFHTVLFAKSRIA